MEIRTSSKYTLTTTPALPATCAGCRRSANGIIQFVDFNLSLDYFGAVVFCEDCAKEILGVFDYVPVAKLEVLNEKNHQLREALAIERANVNQLKSAVDAIVSIRPDISGALSSNEGTDEVSSEVSGSTGSNSGESESESDDDDSGPEETELGTDESDAERGPEDISESTESTESKFV